MRRMRRVALAPALMGALALATSGCKRLTSTLSGEEELPPGAVPAASAPPVATYAPAPVAPMASEVTAGPLSFAPIAKRADPSVVTVLMTGEEAEQTFFGRVRMHRTHGLGTGFIIDKDGVILTNNHVVEGAQEVVVKLSDDREFSASVVGTDPRTDVAVIRIKASGLAPIALGDSDAIEVGDWVVAIGNPLGLSHTVSAGIISAKGRTREDVGEGLGDPSGYYSFLQTDAAINPGNSGGPLLNLRGEVVGMNSAIANPNTQGGAQNIGFAIPINMVKQLLPMLLRDGHITRSALGIHVRSARSVSSEFPAEYKVGDKGTVIIGVAPGGPADHAGLQPGDVILAFDGEATDREEKLKWLASVAGVGRQVTLRVSRKGEPFDLKVTLGQLTDVPPPGSRSP
jgi:serine protease Do